MTIVQMPMPNDLVQMDLKVKNGADPDDIPGIERLWIWRARKMMDEIGRAELEFFAALQAETGQRVEVNTALAAAG
jgi:hypothetical protein